MSVVEQLSEGSHRVELALWPDNTVTGLKESLARGFVYVVFPETRGGTELPLYVDRAGTSTDAADLDAGTGRVVVAGDVTLDGTPVRCVAAIDLPAMVGEGRLERRPE